MERFVLWHRILPPAFEEEETTAAAGQWARYVTHEVQNSGGELMSSLAGTVVANFALHELKSAINLALRLLAEAEAQPVPAGGIPIAFGIATGTIQREKDETGRATSSGSAIDRAQLLANQARAGEVVLDVESREAASRTYLFGRSVSTSSFALQGEAIDRGRPLLEECRRAVGLLKAAPVPASIRLSLEPLKRAAAGGESATFYIKGSLGVGARTAVFALRDELRPPAFLDIGAVPGGLEPLGGLRLALLKAWRILEPARQRLKQVEPGVADAIKAVACATPPRREATVHAFKVLLRTLETERGIPWIYIDRLSALDPATLWVLGAALADESVNALLIVRSTELVVPAALRPLENSKRIEIPMIEPSEALLVAAGVLGPDPDMDVAKQLVITGGTTVLGVMEAARTMVATGDLVHDGRRFAWREAFAERRQHLGPRALLEERFATLDTSSMRYLEIACTALPASTAQVIDAAVAFDEIPENTRRRCLDALVNDGLLTPQAKPSSELLRRAVVQRMPPARRSEVYRFVAEALHTAEPLVGPALAATVGAYLCEGGDLERGTQVLLDAGTLAADLGYSAAAVRLAAAAVQYRPDKETRSAATEISKSVRLPNSRPEDEDDERPTIPVPELELASGTDALIRALKEREHQKFDALVESSIAAGGDLTGAHCLRVVSFVGRGDVASAKKALLMARKSPMRKPGAAIRISIASACLQLAHGRRHDAMIDALEALAAARTASDSPGEAAALKLISATCLAAGLDTEASRIAEAAEALAS
ncbi:MAG: hypothetical protein ACN4G0_17370 [Polyangiales bacterium]